jgi:hypothetical protein
MKRNPHDEYPFQCCCPYGGLNFSPSHGYEVTGTHQPLDSQRFEAVTYLLNRPGRNLFIVRIRHREEPIQSKPLVKVLQGETGLEFFWRRAIATPVALISDTC